MRVAFHGGIPVVNRPVVTPAQKNIQFGAGKSLGHPLLDAIADGKMAEFEKQLDAGVSPNIRTTSPGSWVSGNNSALQVAIIYARVDMVKRLLAHPDITLDEKNAYRETALQTAQRQVDRKNTKFVQDSGEKHQRYVEILELVKAGPTPAVTPPVEKPSGPPQETPAQPKPELNLGAFVYDVLSTLSKTLAELAERYKPKS